MKQSHFTTPRTLGECSFVPSADPIERHHGGETPAWWAWVACIAIVGALIVWVTR